MSSAAQTGETHAEEPIKSYASSPQSAPPPLQSSRTNCRSSKDEAGDQLIKFLEKGKAEEAKNVFLFPRAAPIPPPIPPPGFKTDHLPHVFAPRPEPAQTNGPSRKRRRFPHPSRGNIDRLAQNHVFPPPDIELDFAPARPLNGFDDFEPLLERLRSKKRDDEAEGFGELIDFSDVEFDIGEDDGATQGFADLGTDRRGFGDMRVMPPNGRGRLHGAFTGGFDAGYFSEEQWKHDSGVLGTEAMSTFTNYIDDDDRDVPRTRRVPGMIEAGIAQSREDEFGTAWFGGQERHVRSDRSVPGALIELARRRNGDDDEEESSIGATRYMVDEVHHQNMVRALKGKPSLTPRVEVESASTTNTGSVERNLKELAEAEGSAEARKKQRSKSRVSRIPVAVRSRPT